MRFLWILIWVHCQLGAVDVTGRLENGTSGGPGTAQIVQLIRLDQGMSPVGSAANVTGDFSISYDGDLAENRFLLQVIKDGVTYTQPISNPGPHEVEVFDNASEVALGSRMGSLAFFAHSDTMDIAAFIHLDNNSKPRVTYNNPAGTFSFSPPRDYSGIEASTKRESLPLRQQLLIDGDRATLTYPLKPGRTLLMMKTHHPYVPSRANEFRIPLLPDQQETNILVMPASLELEAEGLEFISVDEGQDLKLFAYRPPPGQSEMLVKISGAAAKEPVPEESTAQAEHGQTNPPKITPNELHRYRWLIIGLVVTLLGCLALFEVYRP